MWERPYYPTYYLPADDVRTTMLAPSGDGHHSPSRGEATLLTVTAPGGRQAANAAARYEASPIPELRDLIRDCDAMDEWHEEDEPVYVHPRDPNTGIDRPAGASDQRSRLGGGGPGSSRRAAPVGR